MLPPFEESAVLRGTIVNRTYGTHKKLPGIYFPLFTSNIWPYLLWSTVIVVYAYIPYDACDTLVRA